MSHGGKRAGAGRPKGISRYGEATHSVRIPLSRIEEVKAYLSKEHRFHGLPLFSSSVRAGVPTQADDLIEDVVDLNSLLSAKVDSTFLVKASGDSMVNTPIFEGDILVVERNDSPVSGKIVIASVAGELTVKRIQIESNCIRLIAENPAYPPILIEDANDFKILGIVTHIIHKTN